MTSESPSQRLLAILHADGVGYSRLMAADEASTMRSLEAARDVFRSAIAAAGGRVIDTAGDSVLAVFQTARGAVEAAIAARRALLSAGGPLPFRIGVHLGDVFVQPDGTVYGDGVNVAARLQALAESGGIAISAPVLAAVRGRVAADFEDLGEQPLKNIALPVRAHRIVPDGERPRRAHGRSTRSLWTWAVATVAMAAAMVAAGLSWRDRGDAPVADAGATRAIAVLPLRNLSDDRAQAYLAEAVRDEMVSLLSRVPGLRVAAPQSSERAQSLGLEAVEAARRLGVGYLVDGSARGEGARVRISIRLVDGRDGHVLWADGFDGDAKDALAAQSDLVLRIAHALRLRIDDADLARSGTRDVQAWRLFQQGRAAALEERRALYERALQIDPRYARVHVELGLDVLRRGNRQSEPLDRLEIRRQAVEQADKALRIDPKLTDAHVLLAYAAGFASDDAALAATTRRIMELDPNHPDAHELAAEAALRDGRMDEALAERRKVVELDPLEPTGIANLGGTLWLAGRFREALEQTERAIAIEPRDLRFAAQRSGILLDLGRREEALAAARRAEDDPLPVALLRVFTLAGEASDLARIEPRVVREETAPCSISIGAATRPSSTGSSARATGSGSTCSSTVRWTACARRRGSRSGLPHAASSPRNNAPPPGVRRTRPKRRRRRRAES